MDLAIRRVKVDTEGNAFRLFCRRRQQAAGAIAKLPHMLKQPAFLRRMPPAATISVVEIQPHLTEDVRFALSKQIPRAHQDPCVPTFGVNFKQLDVTACYSAIADHAIQAYHRDCI